MRKYGRCIPSLMASKQTNKCLSNFFNVLSSKFQLTYSNSVFGDCMDCYLICGYFLEFSPTVLTSSNSDALQASNAKSKQI